MFSALSGYAPPHLIVPLAIGFLCIASMMGSLMRAMFFSLIALRLVRRVILPAVGIGTIAKLLIP